MKDNYIVVCAGSCIDEFFEVQNWIQMGDATLAVPTATLVGGCLLNVGAVYSSYGGKTYVMDQLKEGSPDTEMLVDAMHSVGIDTEYLVISPEVENGKCLIMSLKGEKSIFVIPSRKGRYDMADGRIQELLNGAAYIYGMMLNMRQDFGEDCEPLKIAKAHGAKVVFDGQSQYPDDIDLETVQLADILILNDFSYERLSERFGCDAKEKMFAAGAEYVCMTLGEKGCIVYEPDGTETACPAFEVDVVDTTGAGDTFIASFMYGLQQGWSVEKIARYATSAGTRACTVMGAWGGTVKPEEVFAFAKERGVDIEQMK